MFFLRQGVTSREDNPGEKSLTAGRTPEPSGSDSWENAAEAGEDVKNEKHAP